MYFLKFSTARCIGVDEYLWEVKRKERCIVLAVRPNGRRGGREGEKEREAGREGSERVGIIDLVITWDYVASKSSELGIVGVLDVRFWSWMPLKKERNLRRGCREGERVE